MSARQRGIAAAAAAAAEEEAWTLERVAALRGRLLEASHLGPLALSDALPPDVLASVLKKTLALMKKEPVMLEVTADPEAEVVVVGDTHGQLHDLVHMMELVGPPSDRRIYVFNGDYVDRGAWGVEVLALLLTLKLAAPRHVHLIRGNHESIMCTRFYGFMAELRAKYPSRHGDLYASCKRMFGELPLAAVINGATLVLHGGLFRKPAPPPVRQVTQRGKRPKSAPPTVSQAPEDTTGATIGSLADLKAAYKGGLDPDGSGRSLVAADVTWSDPCATPGFSFNCQRNVGITFGPDVTQRFLEANGLRLILRSHEGPDARDKRDDMPQVLQGWSLDHDTPAGRLYTVFSAPDYPQFQSAAVRHNNRGAVAVLSGPGWDTPRMVEYDAKLPRPQSAPYYELGDKEETDDELVGRSSNGGSSCGDDDDDDDVSVGGASAGVADDSGASDAGGSSRSSRGGSGGAAVQADIDMVNAGCSTADKGGMQGLPDCTPGEMECGAAAAVPSGLREAGVGVGVGAGVHLEAEADAPAVAGGTSPAHGVSLPVAEADGGQVA